MGGRRLEGCGKTGGSIWKHELEILRKVTGHVCGICWKTGVPKCISRRDLPVPGIFFNFIPYKKNYAFVRSFVYDQKIF